MVRILYGLVLFCIASGAYASVYISEIAWMGDGDSPNNEWVELSGEGNIEGFVLEAEDGTPYIELSGSVSGSRVLYRGTDYTGALENGGEVLVLRDNSGAEIERVDGSDGWSAIGGDNETKETAQRKRGAWVTASPTPGSLLVVEEVVAEEVVVEGGSVSYEAPRLVVELPSIEGVVSGSETLFSVSVGNSHGARYSGALVEWNFGDGTTRIGESLYHQYHHPGEYVVMVTVSYGGEKIVERMVVSVRASNVSVLRIDETTLRISNEADEEINISRWRVVDGGSVFVFPEHTMLLPQGSLLLSHKVTGFLFSEDVVLQYSNGEVVSVEEVSQVEERVVYVPVPEVAIEEEVLEVVPQVAAAVVSEPASRFVSVWVYVWFVLVLGVGGIILFIRRYG